VLLLKSGRLLVIFWVIADDGRKRLRVAFEMGAVSRPRKRNYISPGSQCIYGEVLRVFIVLAAAEIITLTRAYRSTEHAVDIGMKEKRLTQRFVLMFVGRCTTTVI
jgi:hypothetical protein